MCWLKRIKSFDNNSAADSAGIRQHTNRTVNVYKEHNSFLFTIRRPGKRDSVCYNKLSRLADVVCYNKGL